MKWFRKKKNNQTQEIEQIEDKQQDIDFTDEIFSNIAEMKLKLENIKSEEEIYEGLKSLIEDFEKYIEKSSELIEERKIEDKLQRIKESNIILELNPDPQIPQSTKDRVIQELTIEDYYKNIKAVFETKYHRATQIILMKKVEKFNHDMDKLLFGQVDFDTISRKDVEEIKIYYEILKQKTEEFTGIMQNKYVERLIELQYKISMIDIVSNTIEEKPTFYDSISEIIKQSQSTKSKQLIWSRLFINGAENLIGRANNEYIKKLKSEMPKINLKDNKEEVLEESLLINYLKGMAQIQIDKNHEKEEQDKQKQEKQRQLEKEQEEKRKKEELEKLSTISTSEIEEKIKELDDDKFDIVTSYKNIMDYQLKIARAKGLIDERNILAIDDIEISRVERGRLPIIFANLKKNICNCEIYTDIDDSKNNVYIITPNNITSNLDEDPYFSNIRCYYALSSYQATDKFVNTFLLCSNTNYIKAFVEGKMYYNGDDRKKLKKEIKNLINRYKEENEEDSKKIKFYIEIPYRRTIIPTLEELQQNQIEFVIPPMDEETKMNEPTVKIYMDRSDLEKYKENVHKNISSIQKGIVKIGEEKINIDEILVEGCDFPFLEEKER